jgi:O-antigen/teichoic acid export membrane protein
VVSRAELGRIVREGWPLIAAGTTSIAHLRIDQIMLGSMAPLHMLADYSLAARLAETVSVFQVALAAAFYPSLVRAFRRAPSGFDAHMQRYYDLHALSGYLGAAVLVIAAVSLFVPMFGEDYAHGVSLLCILALAVPAQLLSGARGAMLTIRGWMHTALAASSIALGLNVLANLVLIPAHGATGAAWATVGSTWLACLALPVLLPWLRPFGKGAVDALLPWRAMPRVMALAGGAK